MAKTRRPYAGDFREKMVALVRSRRSPAELSREFEPTAQTIVNWVRQADRDAGRRGDGLTSEEPGVRLSMGSTGDCYDNALCESFFATLECELIDRATFRTRREAELAIFDFIEGFYNNKRRHSSIGYLSPAEFERRGGWDHMREAA